MQMKQISSDTYTIAWFKLAECVTRGERERAFGVYRLLSHSIDDRALALQLEGDLFLAFDMPQEAIGCFEKAALRYKQAGRLLEAASVFEHMCTLNSKELAYKKELLQLYANLQSDVRVADLACVLVQGHYAAQQFDAIRTIAPLIAYLDSYAAQAICYEKIVYILLLCSKDPELFCMPFVEYMVSALLQHGNDQLLQQTLQKLKHTHDGLYQAAVRILEK